MKAFYNSILVLCVIATIAGWIGSFLYGISGQYMSACIMLVVSIVSTFVYVLVRETIA